MSIKPKFSNWSEKQYYSFDFKMEKNNSYFFKTLLKKLNEDPNNMIFIDDYDVNVENAKEVGIKGILYTSNKQLEKDLLKLDPETSS